MIHDLDVMAGAGTTHKLLTWLSYFASILVFINCCGAGTTCTFDFKGLPDCGRTLILGASCSSSI